MSGQKELNKFVNNLISLHSIWKYNHVCLSYDDLSDLDKQDFAALMFEADGCDLSVISENNDRNKIQSLLVSVLRQSTLDNKIELANTLRDSMVSYYEKNMVSLLEEKVLQYEESYYSDAGLTKGRHTDNGESYWGRQYG